MNQRSTKIKMLNKVLVLVGLLSLLPLLPLGNLVAPSRAELGWSLNLAIHDLKFYPDQLFPALAYPIDYDAISLPEPVNDKTIQIPVGSTVSWVNKDRNPGDEKNELTINPHLIQVIGPDGKPIAQSPMLGTLGQTFTERFDEAGEFSYRCAIHPMKMRGKITVLPWGLELVNR